MKDIALLEITRRTNSAKKLAKFFPELKGLSFQEMLEKCPVDLDFITANELHKALNPSNLGSDSRNKI